MPLLKKLIVSFADMDECEDGENRCNVNALCSNTLGSYVCRCIRGFEGDGLTCVGRSLRYTNLKLILKWSSFFLFSEPRTASKKVMQLCKDSLIQIKEERLGGERRKVVFRASSLILRGFAALPSRMLSVYVTQKKKKRLDYSQSSLKYVS